MGYNTLVTIFYVKQNNLDIKLNIFSPEMDLQLIQSLKNFQYPKELKEFKFIIDEISTNLSYSDKNIFIQIYNGDARDYIKTLNNIDIVYQDAFSSDINKILWTKEYFTDIYKILSNNAILTTYSIATPVRLGMYENNFYIYEYQNKNKKINKITIALNKKLQPLLINYKYIDMELKQKNNPNAKSLRD